MSKPRSEVYLQLVLTAPNMKIVVLAISVAGMAPLVALGQWPTWVEDIAPLVHDHCAQCHHTGGPGPFSLVTYEDVFFTAGLDLHAMQDGEMPPWPADPDYRHFVGENVLS